MLALEQVANGGTTRATNGGNRRTPPRDTRDKFDPSLGGEKCRAETIPRTRSIRLSNESVRDRPLRPEHLDSRRTSLELALQSLSRISARLIREGHGPNRTVIGVAVFVINVRIEVIAIRKTIH